MHTLPFFSFTPPSSAGADLPLLHLTAHLPPKTRARLDSIRLPHQAGCAGPGPIVAGGTALVDGLLDSIDLDGDDGAAAAAAAMPAAGPTAGAPAADPALAAELAGILRGE